MRNRATSRLLFPKIRQSWSKYNLYNLSRMRSPLSQSKTHFQQKWQAKSLLRAYHGEPVREGQWERMFSRRLRAVVPMDAEYLASNDGSVESAGRGSGLESAQRTRNTPLVPFMQMTFAPLERRLDTAIFRALFASSTRQARQFVIHGAVTVNGKKMHYPGYLLNPGDMFQVDVDRVMYATGAPKDVKLRRSGRKERLRLKKAREEGEDGEKQAAKPEESPAEETAKTEPAAPEDHRKMLKQMLSHAKGIMTDNKEILPGKRRQEIRIFQQSVKRVLSRSSTTTTMTDNLEAQFLALKHMLQEETKAAQDAASDKAAKQAAAAQVAAARDAAEKAALADPSAPSSSSSTSSQTTSDTAPATDGTAQTLSADLDSLSGNDLQALRQALEELHDNPIDSTKPYATPWRPRDYMSPFAFVPRYLEVNHSICAAVYLRHPVARSRMAEVPTPFGEFVSGAAFAWYLRRR